MSKPVLLIDRTDPHIAILTLNRPNRRNALSIELIDALRTAIEESCKDTGRRVLILRGSGPSFCAGLDFTEAQNIANSHQSAQSLAALYRALCAAPLVTIASAHGAALGGGAGLIAACDLAVASDDLQLGYPEVRRGLVAALVTCLLRRQVSGRRLREILLLGQTLNARQAIEAGLINRVVPASSLTSETAALAEAVSESAPGAVARTKRLLDDLDGIASDLQIALDVHLAARDSQEAAEGIAAFFEKRVPRWSAD